MEEINVDIPPVIKSCVRVINLFGLHHHGIFRVSGSQVEIAHIRDAFERGDDPLADVTDASDINSVAGVLKLYLRELREPLFPIQYFDHFMELARKYFLKHRNPETIYRYLYIISKVKAISNNVLNCYTKLIFVNRKLPHNYCFEFMFN